MTDPALFASLALLTLFGIVLTFFGFEIVEPLLRVIGAVVGVIVGGLIGIVVVPTVSGESIAFDQQLGLTVALVVGGLFGSVFVPALKRLAIGGAAFVATTFASLLLLTGERVVDVVLDAISVSALATDPIAVIETITTDPVFQSTSVQQGVAAAVVLGLVGSGLGLIYYTDIVSVAMTVAGAGLLAVVIPLWIAGIRDEFVIEAGASEFSFAWFVLALAAGLGFQLFRHFDALLSEDDAYQTLEEKYRKLR